MRISKNLFSKVSKVIADERNLDQSLNDLEDAAVTTKQGATPEPMQILLVTSLIRATLEQSRRRWIILSALLGVALLVCLGLLLLMLFV